MSDETTDVDVTAVERVSIRIPDGPGRAPLGATIMTVNGVRVRGISAAQPGWWWPPTYPTRTNCARTPCPHWTSSAPAGATWVCFEHRRELGPSAVEAAPERQRDTFADLADEWDMLPDVKP